MVRFDSHSKSLLLSRTTNVDGQSLKTGATSIELSQVREDARQLAISIAKLCITYANGGELDRPRVSKSKDGEEEKHPSLIEELYSLINKLYPKSEEGSSTKS